MKLENFMLGDWVLYNGTPTKIGLESLFYSGVFEPIPLTSEFLEENGFVYTKPQLTTESEDKVWQYQNDEKQVLIEIEEQTDDDLLDFYIGKFISGPNDCEIYFKHVHKLQHALKLCGIEKEITL